jgi:hypothetical protein
MLSGPIYIVCRVHIVEVAGYPAISRFRQFSAASGGLVVSERALVLVKQLRLPWREVDTRYSRVCETQVAGAAARGPNRLGSF